MTNSTEETKPSKTVIRLTRIKQWLVVADVDSYKVLKALGAPMLRVHHNFLPTLGLLMKKQGVRAKSVDFESEILDPFLQKTASTWVKKYGKCTITSKVMVFQAGDDKIKAAEEAIPKLEGLLHDFFSRWGYRASFQYSKSKTGNRIKFHVEYWFDSEKMPILPLETPIEEIPKVQFKIGFTRLTFSFEDPSRVKHNSKAGHQVHLMVEVSQGGVFKPIHTTKCLYSQLSSVQPLLLALMSVLNHDQHNLDNPAS